MVETQKVDFWLMPDSDTPEFISPESGLVKTPEFTDYLTKCC